MSKISEQKALEAYPEVNPPYRTNIEAQVNVEHAYKREGYIRGYDQALCDIKQRIKEIIEHQEKEWGKSNVDIGLYTILGHIVETEEEL